MSVSKLELPMFSISELEWLVIDPFPIFFHTFIIHINLKTCLKVPKVSATLHKEMKERRGKVYC